MALASSILIRLTNRTSTTLKKVVAATEEMEDVPGQIRENLYIKGNATQTLPVFRPLCNLCEFALSHTLVQEDAVYCPFFNPSAMAEPPGTNSSHLGSSPLPFPIPNFGNAFVEISALTTLIGSSVAESLILGNQGGAGVAWAAMSAFGLMDIVKTCVGAASPGWLRTVIGARSENTDAAVGLEVASSGRGRGAMKVRRSYGERGPSGLSVDASLFLNARRKQTDSEHKIKWEEIYAFDKLTSRGLAGFPDDKPYEAAIAPKNIALPDPQAYTARRNIKKPSKHINMTPDVYLYGVKPSIPLTIHGFKFQSSSSVLSKLERASSYTTLLAPSALLLLFLGLVARRPQVLDEEIDIIVGQFPTMTQLAESSLQSRVVIGAPRNPRKAIWWKAAWILGALICPLVTGFTYLFLAQQTNEIVMLWLMFQALWLLGRMLVHYFAESPKEVIAPRLLYKRPWETLPGIFRERVVNLMVALSKYMISVHPRQEHAYRDNASTPSELRRIIIETPTMLNYPLNESLKLSNYKMSQVDIEIHAVIGDPTLVSAVWLANVPGLTFENMYDTCILSLKLPLFGATSQYATIPCVHFLAGVPALEPLTFDEETNQPLDSVPQFYAKGRLQEPQCTWWYLIPAGERSWLVVRQDFRSPVLGKHSAEVMSDERVTAILSRGNLLISIAHVSDVKSALENSRMARETLTEILS
ncbi:hypothetical protein K443DRAFT_3365 [Laccaria amethystina LaAM-08-1]|uniref:Uncharacterized protein n=1 Tax=Laccaria amethystina LaAM-08-1 TaxID=1095629 RepID=A0A0C9YD17_9AGAR|nr:hypothetical protein K443DRAFT_3365 [Laccaria amethystina LaAM-08-1]